MHYIKKTFFMNILHLYALNLENKLNNKIHIILKTFFYGYFAFICLELGE